METTFDPINTDKFSFTDSLNRTWNLKLNIAIARRIRSFDFSELTDQEIDLLSPNRDLFGLLYSDSVVMFGVIWAIVQPQGERHYPDMDENGFLEGMDGDSIAAGREAFMESLSDFIPEHRNALLELRRQVKRGMQRISLRLQEMTPEIDQAMDDQIDREMEQAVSGLKVG